MKDNEIRVISGKNEKKKYFCRAFAARCRGFENTGLCERGDCVYADKHIPSEQEILRLYLIELRRTQMELVLYVPSYEKR